MTWILIILLLLSIVINVVLYKLLSVQFTKIKKYDEIILEYNGWITYIQSFIKHTYLKMKQVDSKNLFFKDDDVGFVFSELLNLISKLDNESQLQTTYETNKEKKDLG